MGRLNLVIADIDENYLKGLGNYLLVHYSARFNIHIFSSPEKLDLFLDSYKGLPDIILYSSSFQDAALLSGKAHTVIRLSENGIQGLTENISMIPKYRHAEQLVQDILHIYSRNSSDTFVPDGKTGTAINIVHSSSGGTGNTSIAAGLSMLSARRGLKALYLSFESIPSTCFYFKGSSPRNFSDVIYILKEKGNNLALKLEGACCCDPASGVHYFLPPDSANELDDLTEEDIGIFFGAIRSSSLFDIAFIDLPSGLGKRNDFIIKSSDSIIEVCTYGSFSEYRKAAMIKDPSFSKICGEYSSSRIFHILSRYSSNMPCDWFGEDNKDRFSAIINESEELKLSLGEKLLIDIDPTFSASLGKLLDCIIAGGVEKKGTGGAAIG